MLRPLERNLICRIEFGCMDPVELLKVSIADYTSPLVKNPEAVVTAVEDVYQVSTHARYVPEEIDKMRRARNKRYCTMCRR